MADNLDISQGTGTTVATDQVGSAHYQKVKLVDGTADSSAAIPGDASNGLDVDVTRVQGTVTVDASGTTVPVSNAALTELGAAINTNRVDVNIAADAVGVGGGTQYTEADTDASITGNAVLGESAGNTLNVIQLDASKNLKVDIAADDVGIGSGVEYTEGDIDASITGKAMLMEVAADTLQPVQGTVAAGLLVNLGTNNDVDTELPAAAALSDTTGNPTSPMVGAATMVFDGTNWQRARNIASSDNQAGSDATLRVGALGYVYDGTNWDMLRGNSTDGMLVNLGTNNDVTVTGSVTANAGTNLNTSLLALESGGNLATIAGDTTAIQTATELIDDTVYVDDADWTDNTSKHLLVGGLYQSAPQTVTDGDVAPFEIDSAGNLKVTLATTIQAIASGAENDSIGVATIRRSDAFQATVTSADATSATSVKAKTAAKSIYVTDIIISVDTAMTVQLQDDAVSPEVLMEQIYMAANTRFEHTFSTPIEVATNQDLDVITSQAGNISVMALGYVI